MVRSSSITVYSGARTGDEKVQCFSCLSVAHLDDRDCANDLVFCLSGATQ